MTGSCEPPWVLGIEPWSDVRVTRTSSCLVVSPVQRLLFSIIVNNIINGRFTLLSTINISFIIGFSLSICHKTGIYSTYKIV